MPSPKGKFLPTSRLNLNLLYPQGISPKLPARFLKWLLAYGRFIVVVVEVIVLGCFVMRFKLDEQLNQQKQDINARIPYLESLINSQTLNSQTQQRLSLIKTVYALSDKNTSILKKVSDQIPISVVLQNINLENSDDGTDFKMTSQTSNNYDVAVFLNGLRGDPNLTDVNLASISFDQGKLTFTITGQLK